ncbi:type VI secretion system baseplate subunit TssF [Pseudomonas sp. TE3610]
MSMDHLLRQYFMAEMRYLREAGQEFAQQFPEQGRDLGLDNGQLDPEVARLFKGFALLMGRVREKLDDDFPELTEELVGLVWPQYLRGVPSLTMVELTPDLSQMSRCELVDKGLEVVSHPIKQDIQCRFTTTQDVLLRPLVLESHQQEFVFNGEGLLRLRFARGPLAAWRDIDLGNSPIYLKADPALAYALHYCLALDLAHIRVRYPGVEQPQAVDAFFTLRGFCEQDRLWPRGEGAAQGYQLLLEYFTFPEKFLFLTLCGLERLTVPEDAAWFELEVELQHPWPADLRLKQASLHLHVVPAINLFPLAVEPLVLAPLASEYSLRALYPQDGFTQVYSVDEVRAVRDEASYPYMPFKSFRHKGGMLRDEIPERYFHTRLKRCADASHDTVLVLGGDGLEQDRLPPTEPLTLRVTGSHGTLPRLSLRPTLLDTPVRVGQLTLAVRNLCMPTLPCYPPDRERFHWQVLGHQGSHTLHMLDNAEALRSTLALYDWTDSEVNQRRLAAILKVEHFLHQHDRMHLERGVDIEITLDEGGFLGPGDIGLFGEVISHFFALYADVHLFNRVMLVLHPSGQCLAWPVRRSRRIPG